MAARTIFFVNDIDIKSLFLFSYKSIKYKLAGSIKIFRKSDAPSIPSQGQSYGYEEAEDGTLIKHNPPARDNTLGPAYYRTKSNETYPTMKYKGVHFGNLTEKRHEFKPREGPGPADYDVIQESAVHYENVNIRKEDQKKCDLYVPRYHEEIVLQEEKKRFAPVKSFTPAPGTYNETRSALESLKKASKTRHVPFGHTSVRFRQDYRMHKTPDPAFYNILNYSIAAQSLKKAVLEKKKKGAFGSTVPRLLYLVKREAFTTPGPADYQLVSVGVGILMLLSILQEAPAPGSYDVQKSFEKSQCKSEYMSPRTVAAKRKHASFLSGTFRKGMARVRTDVPGMLIIYIFSIRPQVAHLCNRLEWPRSGQFQREENKGDCLFPHDKWRDLDS
uniref:Sperm tail PG-rich repeat containing 2 n=1 Tax=Varanus komodoensis TaxID=61221 RepID=A0A8D2L3M6_VARKO